MMSPRWSWKTYPSIVVGEVLTILEKGIWRGQSLAAKDKAHEDARKEGDTWIQQLRAVYPCDTITRGTACICGPAQSRAERGVEGSTPDCTVGTCKWNSHWGVLASAMPHLPKFSTMKMLFLESYMHTIIA